MNKANLAIARKVVLCAGLLVSALLFLYPHWRGSFGFGVLTYEYDSGRGLITAPPIPEPRQIVQMIGFDAVHRKDDDAFEVVFLTETSYRVHRIRQLTEVAVALLFTVGLMRVLKKPPGD